MLRRFFITPLNDVVTNEVVFHPAICDWYWYIWCAFILCLWLVTVLSVNITHNFHLSHVCSGLAQMWNFNVQIFQIIGADPILQYRKITQYINIIEWLYCVVHHCHYWRQTATTTRSNPVQSIKIIQLGHLISQLWKSLLDFIYPALAGGKYFYIASFFALEDDDVKSFHRKNYQKICGADWVTRQPAPPTTLTLEWKF